MTKRILVSGFLAAGIVAGCGGSASTAGSLPDSASTYVVTSRSNGNNGNGNGSGTGTTTGTNPVVFSGQGLPMTELCGVANGAEVDGPYLLWVFTAAQADSATITGPWGTKDMVRSGNSGTFKYVSDYTDPSTLIGVVSATYVGDAKNPQLVLSHGCPKKKGAWCSPGYWIHAENAAWELTGQSKTDPFNSTVYDDFYGATFPSAPTLYGVLTAGNPSPYKGEGVAGTSGCAMNAFNAVGAFLTSKLEGYEFSCALMQADDDSTDADDPCPIDHFGNWKPAPQPVTAIP